MESNLNNRDFERFLKQNADQYRMIPSERVWQGISDTLHDRRRRWLGFGLALLFLTASLVTWVMLLPGNKNNKQAYLPAPAISAKLTKGMETKEIAGNNPGPVKSGNINDPFTSAPEGLQEDFFSISAPVNSGENNEPADETVNNNFTIRLPETSSVHTPVPVALNQPNRIDDNNNPVPASETGLTAPVTATSTVTTDKPAQSVNPQASQKEKDREAEIPVMKDRIAKNSSQKLARKSLKWQLYVTPTISYRSLSENANFIAASRYNNFVNGGPAVYYPTDVNTMVNHRPDLGFQLGVRAAYPLSKWFSLTAGLQFSVSKYDIKAYRHPAEVATIALTDRSVRTVSNYRNTNGYNENWLRNFYFSASVPVGAELKLSDGNKNYFGIAATLQPTYVLDNRAYLISADYKNYAEMPSLTRKWNLNSSFELFSAHTTGKVHWRVGPQVRYQTMSSFVKNYPIKEHLFDFGLKLGIQLK